MGFQRSKPSHRVPDVMVLICICLIRVHKYDKTKYGCHIRVPEYDKMKYGCHIRVPEYDKMKYGCHIRVPE